MHGERFSSDTEYPVDASKVRRALDITKVSSEKEKPFRFLCMSLKTNAFLELHDYFAMTRCRRELL